MVDRAASRKFPCVSRCEPDCVLGIDSWREEAALHLCQTHCQTHTAVLDC